MGVSLAVKLLPFLMTTQAISGTFNGAFQDFNMYGVPNVRLTLTLQCSLTCPTSAPELHFRVAGGVNATFLNAPSDSSAYISAFFGNNQTGLNDTVIDSFKPGSMNKVTAQSCSCHCGNRTGEGGFVTLEAPTIVVPPWLSTAYVGKAGEMSFAVLSAAPKGPETIVVTVVGPGGLNTSQTYSPADFGTQTSAQIRFTPLAAGDVTITATMQPSGVSKSLTFTVAAGNTSTGGGSGSTGGGDGSTGGGGGDAEPSGCSSLGLGPLALVTLALLRRRR